MEIQFKRSDILHYLQADEKLKDANIERLILESITEIKELIRFRYLYQKFPLVLKDNKLKVLETTLILKGNSILKHLAGAAEVYLMAATLGPLIDKKIAYYEKISVTKSLVFDACATTAIEYGCDQIEKEIKQNLSSNSDQKEEKQLTFRYSPGYGDLDISIQSEFLQVLKAPKKIGLTASKYNILLPAKSVTAIIGVVSTEQSSKTVNNNQSKRKFDSKKIALQQFEAQNCQHCLLAGECDLRKRGIYCGLKS
jgi:hypothetical protein